MIAYCGLKCDTCPIHLATLEQDRARQLTMRKSIAKECSKHYGMDIEVKDITDCDGCRVNSGRLFSGCINCKVRKCAIENNIESCAYCSDYICEILSKHFTLDPKAKIRIEKIRQAN